MITPKTSSELRTAFSISSYLVNIFFFAFGSYWEEQTSLPIPLGGIVGKRSLDKTILKQADKWIRKSIEFSYSNYPLITEYVKQHSQEMEEEVMKKHIDLYVNNYSVDLGEDGKNAIKKFIGIYN